MWCPKCKNEYVKGITECVDCGCELVDELPKELDPNEPQIIGSIRTETDGKKWIRFLHFSGLQTCGLIPTEEETGYYLVAAYHEWEHAIRIVRGLSESGEADENETDEDSEMKTEPTSDADETIDLDRLVPILEKQLEEIQDEEANELLSDLRTEASTVYVNKKDKFTDLKFSGYSFILFGVIGYALIAVNAAGLIHLFTTYSMAILFAVFTLFLGIGVSSLRKAAKIKSLVSEEETVVERVEKYMEERFTDEYLESLSDHELPEEENFFHVTELLKKELAGQFPLFSKGYIDQLADERYGEFCDSRDMS